MLKISHTRILAALLGCFAIAAAAVSMADEQSPPTQSSQAQPATPASPPAASQPDATVAPQQPSTQTAQPAPSQGAEQSAAKADDSQSPKAANVPNWPAPERYNATSRGIGDSRNGGSLGVSIVGDSQGIMIMRVHPGTPAEQMGLRPRDRITSVNGNEIDSSDEFISRIRSMKPGDEVELVINRDERPTTLRGKLEPFSQALARQPVGSGTEWTPSPLAGDSSRSNSLQTTSYEERNGRSPSGDVEARLSRVEQQLDQLTRDVAEIRAAIKSNSSTSAGVQNAAPAGLTNPPAPSALRPTPGEPPSSVVPPRSR